MNNTTSLKKQNRQSNFELLRIFAMILIIAHHFAVHGKFEFSTEYVTISKLWVQFIMMGGKIGVNIFVLITGYFLVKNQKLNFSKVIKFYLQVLFYSIIIFFLFTFFGLEEFSIKELIKTIFPITFGKWWFASTYLVLYILSPFLNMFLLGLDKKTYQTLLLLSFVMWCIIPTISSMSFESNSLIWFMYLYLIAGYVRLWHNNSEKNARVYFLTSIALTLLTFLSVVIFDVVGKLIPLVGNHATYLYKMQAVPILLISLLYFLGFKNLNIGYNKYINLIATSTFGIYLIHDNSLMRNFLWLDFFKNAYFKNSIVIIPYSILVICVVFLLCSVIELIRIFFFEKYYLKIIEKIKPKCDKIIDLIMIKVSKFI